MFSVPLPSCLPDHSTEYLSIASEKGSEYREWKQAEGFQCCFSGPLCSPGLAEGRIIPKAEICKCPFAHRQAEGVRGSRASRTEAGKEKQHAVRHSPGCEGKMTYVCLFPLRVKECQTSSQITLHSISSPADFTVTIQSG